PAAPARARGSALARTRPCGLSTPNSSVRLTASTYAHATALQPGPQGRVAAVGLVRGHPRGWDAGVQGTLQHDLGELRLGPKPNPLGDLGGPAARRILGPALGQVQLPVDHRPPLGAGVGQEDAELAVVDLAGRAGVLALHPD